MKRYMLVTSLVLLLPCLLATAQTEESEVQLIQLEQSGNCEGDEDDESPMGSISIIRGEFCSPSVDEPFARIRQVGDDNTALIHSHTGEADIRVWQIGDGHSFTADIREEGVRDWAIQRGSNNSIQHLLNAEGIFVETFQIGRDLELTQIEHGGGFPRYVITQVGEGMSVIINNGVVR